jgi:hypothetical protein
VCHRGVCVGDFDYLKVCKELAKVVIAELQQTIPGEVQVEVQGLH